MTQSRKGKCNGEALDASSITDQMMDLLKFWFSSSKGKRIKIK